ncbi:MAG: hypothetical protein ACE5DY_07100 [Mariprofundaceae bacterium]
MSDKKNIDDILANLDRLLDEGVENEPEEENELESAVNLGPETFESSPEVSTIDDDFSHGQMSGGSDEAEAVPVAKPESCRRKLLLTADMLVEIPPDFPDDKSS